MLGLVIICFTLLLSLPQDFHEVSATEAFRKADKDGSGFISALDFQDIMVSIKSHLLTKDVKTNLVAVSITNFKTQSNTPMGEVQALHTIII